LAIKLSKINLDRNRQWYIVSGDVVAFYPNIPLDECLVIVAELYEEYIGKPTMNQELHEMDVFLRCLQTGNKDLVTQYKDLVYKQRNGLAMGVVDSPDVANLSGWFFERQSQIFSHPLVPFYRWFIDDIIGIVYASSETEALTIMNIIKFNGCVIEWSASNHYTPFLDMTIYPMQIICCNTCPTGKRALTRKEFHEYLTTLLMLKEAHILERCHS
jgi:hypothetical protein